MTPLATTTHTPHISTTKGNTVNTSRSRKTRGLAALGTAALALGSILLVATPAAATPGDAGTGTITVHKLEQTNGAVGSNDGSELTVTGAIPLVAGFTACAIDGIDLANSTQWNRLKNLSATLNGSGDLVVTESGTPRTTTCVAEQTTTLPAGTTSFTLAADKAYVIYESTAAANSVSVAQPTIVTVPFPGNGAAGQPVWNYSPHIYPKNIIAGSGATKEGRIVGDKVAFDVSVPIKPLTAGEDYTELRVNDQLSSALKYTEGSVTLRSSTAIDVPLTAGTDYTLTAPSGTNGVEVVLDFLAPGLAKLDANIGGSVVLSIKADATATGTTANEAKITLNGKSTAPGSGPKVTDPKGFFTGAHVLAQAKNKGAASNVALVGAGFTVFPVAASATDCATTQPDIATAVINDDISLANGKTPDRVLAEGKYCVYESTVPSGYKGLTGGMLFTLAGADAELTVVNTQNGADAGDLPLLPMTGGTGSVLLVSAGAVLLLGGILLIVVRRRKAKIDA